MDKAVAETLCVGAVTAHENQYGYSAVNEGRALYSSLLSLAKPLL